MTNARALGKLAQQADINTPILDDEMNKLLNHCELIKRTQLLTLWWQGWYDGLYEDAEKKGINTRSVV